MQQITITDFNQKPDFYLQEITDTQEDTIILKNGMPFYKILPLTNKNDNSLKNSIIFEGDLLSPIEDNWEVNL